MRRVASTMPATPRKALEAVCSRRKPTWKETAEGKQDRRSRRVSGRQRQSVENGAGTSGKPQPAPRPASCCQSAIRQVPACRTFRWRMAPTRLFNPCSWCGHAIGVSCPAEDRRQIRGPILPRDLHKPGAIWRASPAPTRQERPALAPPQKTSWARKFRRCITGWQSSRLAADAGGEPHSVDSLVFWLDAQTSFVEAMAAPGRRNFGSGPQGGDLVNCRRS